MPFDFLFPLKGVSGDDGDIHTGLWFLRPCYISHVQPNLSLGSGSNSFERLTSVVLNAILNLGVKQSLENNHHKSLLRVATFREKE